MRAFKDNRFEYSKPNDKCIGSPVTINAQFQCDSKDMQGITIAYLNNQFEKTASRIKRPMNLDKCENYIIEGE